MKFWGFKWYLSAGKYSEEIVADLGSGKKLIYQDESIEHKNFMESLDTMARSKIQDQVESYMKRQASCNLFAIEYDKKDFMGNDVYLVKTNCFTPGMIFFVETADSLEVLKDEESKFQEQVDIIKICLEEENKFNFVAIAKPAVLPVSIEATFRFCSFVCHVEYNISPDGIIEIEPTDI